MEENKSDKSTEKQRKDAEWLEKYRKEAKERYSDPNFKPSDRYGRYIASKRL